uniref:Uncharacterized protein n=1 Tax=Pristionchus pacificus TaxID=54126 RepID=A0A2A6CU78_PRIPA
FADASFSSSLRSLPRLRCSSVLPGLQRLRSTIEKKGSQTCGVSQQGRLLRDCVAVVWRRIRLLQCLGRSLPHDKDQAHEWTILHWGMERSQLGRTHRRTSLVRMQWNRRTLRSRIPGSEQPCHRC